MVFAFMIRTLLLPIPLLLVACQDKDTSANGNEQPGITANIMNESDSPRPAPEPRQPPPAEAPAPEPVETPSGLIPASFQGRWTGVNERCGDRSASLELTIDPKRLLFHESVGDITAVKSDADKGLSVTAAFTGEGESWTRTLQLRTTDDGDRLTIVNDGTAVTRKRC